MRIALLGYGKMGKELERLITKEKKHEIVSISFKNEKEKIDTKGIKKADVVIDFTSPQIVLENIKKICNLRKNMVVGTTGWYQHLNEVEKMVKKSNIGLIYSPNFSIGANIFFKIISFSAKLLSNFSNYYDVFGFEIHHRGKKDSPSGTALKIAKEILKNFQTKKTIQTEKLNRKIYPEELHFASIRGGRNPGFHQVVFDSPADEIVLSHSAHNREGFAKGAILAAEFIKDKKGFYNFEEIFLKGRFF